jgi:hypothetical protein
MGAVLGDWWMESGIGVIDVMTSGGLLWYIWTEEVEAEN